MNCRSEYPWESKSAPVFVFALVIPVSYQCLHCSLLNSGYLVHALAFSVGSRRIIVLAALFNDSIVNIFSTEQKRFRTIHDKANLMRLSTRDHEQRKAQRRPTKNATALRTTTAKGPCHIEKATKT